MFSVSLLPSFAVAKCHENRCISNGEAGTIAAVGFSCDREGGNTRIFIGGYSPRGLEDGSSQCGPGLGGLWDHRRRNVYHKNKE